MANGLWIGCVQDGFGRVISSGALIEVRDEADDLVTIYADREGTKTKGNPFLTTEDGVIKFYCEAGRVSINASKGGQEYTFPDEIILDNWGNVCICGTAYANITSLFTAVSDVAGVVLNESSNLGVDGTIFLLTLVFRTPTDEGDLAPAWSLEEDNVNLQVVGSNGPLVIFKGVTNGPGNDLLTIYINGDAPVGPGFGGYSFDGHLTVWEGLADGECTIQRVGYPTDNDGGINLDAEIDCEFAAGLMLVYSDAGMATPDMDGFDTVALASAGNFGLYTTEDYFSSSQGLSIVTGSGDMYGIVVAMRTKFADVEPPVDLGLGGLVVLNDSDPYTTLWSPTAFEDQITYIDDLIIDGATSMQDVDFSPDGSMAVFVTHISPHFHIVLTNTWEATDVGISIPDDAQCVKWSPDGTMIAVSHLNTSPYLTIVETSDWTTSSPASVTSRPQFPDAMAWSPDSSKLICIRNSTAHGSYITTYDSSTWEIIDGPETSVVPNVGIFVTLGDNEYFVLGLNADPYVVLYNTSDWGFARDYAPDGFPTGGSTGQSAIAYNAVTQKIAVGTWGGVLVTIDLATWVCENVVEVGDGVNVSMVSYSPNGVLLCCTAILNPYIKVYETATMTEVPLTDDFWSYMYGARFSPLTIEPVELPPEGDPTFWNPFDKNANIVLSNENVTATHSFSGWAGVRGDSSRNSGKWYFEIYVGNQPSPAGICIGIAAGGTPLNTILGSDDADYGFADTGTIYSGGANTAYGAGYAESDTIQIAVDFDAGMLWFGIAGVWQEGGDPELGTNPAYFIDPNDYFPATSLLYEDCAADLYTTYANLGYSEPNGFTPWGEAWNGTHTTTKVLTAGTDSGLVGFSTGAGSLSPDATAFAGLPGWTDAVEFLVVACVPGEGVFSLEFNSAVNPFGVAWEAGDLVSVYVYDDEAAHSFSEADFTYGGDGFWSSDIYGGSFIANASVWRVQVTMILRTE